MLSLMTEHSLPQSPAPRNPMISFDLLVLWEKIMVPDEATRQNILNLHPHLDGRITVHRFCPPGQILTFNPSVLRPKIVAWVKDNPT